MESNELKNNIDIDIKNNTCYYIDDIITTEDPNFLI